jgi:hypothetical protein
VAECRAVTLSKGKNMRPTRLQTRGRPTKRPMGRGTVNSSSGTITTVSGRVPRADVRGYPETGGLASPVLVESTSAPAPEPAPEPEPEPDPDADGEVKAKRKSKAKGK